MDTNVSENEETEKETNKTKVSDSGYSNSCSNNSQSQRSNSSKSQHSTSSGSSGYCGHPSTLGSGDDNHKKKKAKLQVATGENGQEEAEHDSSLTPPHSADQAVEIKTTPACVDPSVLDNMSSPTMESEALQVAVVAQTLFCIKTNAAEQALDDEEMMTSSPEPVSKEPQTTDMIIGALKTEIKHEKEFCIVVALSDGTVVCTTPSLTNVLGFPKDMWIGRSLINFLHPKDRIAFASHITSAMGHSHFKQKCTNVGSSEKGDDSDYFYCWIRLYNGLRTSGFSVADRKAAYLSCQLSMNFKEVPDQGVFLVATARLVKPAYKAPNESRSNPPTFTIRHTANTLISHVDNDIVPHFGYLPHDMIGRSIFDFYYAEDLAYLKDVYTNVIMEEGLLFLSRPYKFRCQNGDCVMVETEWSSFINPWGKKLEFIIGRHRVLTGPQNPDVVSPVLDFNKTSNNEEEPNESKVFEEEIKALLTEPIVRCYEPSKDQLAQLVESLEKISSSQLQDHSTGLPAPMPSATSEMLGEISPHHVYSDSKSSSETPSYNQLTYNENIQRFFASEPKTAGSDESQATKNETNQSSSSGGEEQKSLPIDSSFNSNSDSCLNESGKSSEPCSNNARVDWAKPESSTRSKETEIASINDQYKSRPLTEKLLYQHNENMNKQMAQNHKKEKNKGQINRKHKIFRNKTLQEIEQEEQGGHGMKRSVSHSWEGEPMKAFKGAHQGQATLLSDSVHPRLPPLPPNLSSGVWPAPPFPVAVTLPPPAQPLAGHLNYSNPLVNPIMQLPCVYMNPLQPAAQPTSVCGARPRASEHPGPPLHRAPIQVPAPQPYMAHQVQYMPSLMYQLPLVPMVYTQPHIIPPTIKPRMTLLPTIGDHMTTLPQVMSDCNKKEKTFHASFPVYSPGFTSPTGKTKSGTYDNDLTHDDTSFCSYSSLFPKTEKSDDSMKDSQDKQNVGQYKMWRGTTGSDSSAALKTLRKEPSWMENIDVTPDLMLRYQMGNCILSQVLQSDFEALLKFNQPEMVNEQLDQLYVDLEGLSKQLSLEESFPSSCSSGDEKHQAGMPSTSTSTYVKTKKKFMGYDKCAMIFEEDAPMPPSAIELLVGGAHSS